MREVSSIEARVYSPLFKVAGSSRPPELRPGGRCLGCEPWSYCGRLAVVVLFVMLLVVLFVAAVAVAFRLVMAAAVTCRIVK